MSWPLSSVLGVVGVLALSVGCGDATNDPAVTATGEPWEQVFAKWSCTADGRPPIHFEVQRVPDSGVVHRWVSDGEEGTASVHTDALYLEGFKGIAYDDYGYTEAPKGTLAALDEFQQGAGVASYHCVRE